MAKPVGKLEKVPVQPIRWPGAAPLRTVIRQTQTSSQVSQLSNSAAPVRAISINAPQPVSIVSVTSRTIGTNKQVTIGFTNDPSDPFFQKVNVHLRQGIGQPVIIGSGTKSPVTVMIPRGKVPGVLLLQAEGNWGPHPIQNSPVRAINLM